VTSATWPRTGIADLEELGLLQLGRGKVISKKDLAATPGSYPVYSSARENDGKFGEYGEYMFDEELITWSVDGGGRLFHRPKHRFSITNVGGFVRILDSGAIDCRFLYFVLTYLHSQVRFDWVRKAHPSVIRKVYADFPLPPLEEQKRIVAVLKQASAALDRARANAQANLADAEELFEATLSATFAKGQDGWEDHTVGDIVTLQRGYDITKKDQRIGLIPVVSSGGASSFHDEAKVAGPGVVIGRKGSIGNVHYVEEAFWPHDTTLYVKDFKGNNPRLVSYLMRDLKLAQLDTGSANPSLNRNLVHPIKVRWPKALNQSEIAQRLFAVEQQTLGLLNICRDKLAELDRLSVTILQKAFAGELT
jgi:type I restriction enzyme S subunit